MRRSRGFTLLEVIIAVSIFMILMLLAIPSLNGVLADKRLRRSYDGLNALVLQAQERAVTEHRPYLIVWQKEAVALRPEGFARDEEEKNTDELYLDKGEVMTISFPAALVKKPPGEWIFWPSGICEPAIIEFKGRRGTWTAHYAPLTGRPELTNYAAR
ncbi:MAG: pilus assembly FimT family protein [Chthoniobacterales bacterium]